VSRPEFTVGSDLLLAELARLGVERFSGTLRVEGARVGGTVVLGVGRVLAAETAAAPGLESLLLRSGRVSGDDWTAAFAEAAPRGELRAALVERELLGSASVQVLTQTAVVDAVFALALAAVHSCTPDAQAPDPPPLVPLSPGMDVDRIARETRRRLTVAGQWWDLGLTPQVRPTATTAAPPLDPRRADLLTRVNGRRSSRDLAFLLGRGLFAVLSDLALLLRDGQIALTPPALPALPTGPAPSMATVPSAATEPSAATAPSAATELPAAGARPAAAALPTRSASSGRR
jgi:hypothetical protein